VAGLTVAEIALVSPAARAHEPAGKPLTANDFKLAAPRGFGDRNNSEPQSMAWWHGRLYAGTAREAICVSEFAVWDAAALNLGVNFANSYLPYPPSDPDLSCAPDGADLSFQAEIWRWTPNDNSWTRVFQSPLALNNPGPEGTAPPQVMWQGKKLPYEFAIRGLAPFTEPDGTEALYAFGTNTDIIWDGTKLPLPRILRSTDGVTFTPLPQDPGTFLGTLSGISDHTSYRSPVSFADKLFVLSSSVLGSGGLIASADPAKGDNAWFLASPPGMLFYDIAVFNGWLYLGGFYPIDPNSGDTPLNDGGYTVVKTRAEGTPPYNFITVVPKGAYLTQTPSSSVVSMQVYRGRLYLGTSTFPEVIRINPDDTWDLVVGAPRAVPSPNGGSEWKYPLSGLDGGFGHTPNDHAWWMENFDQNLYIGTYNLSTSSRLDPMAGPLLLPHMGAHLYRSHDGGWYYSAVTTTGFAKPSDPYGGIFEYGIRTMANTPYGLFVGTSNDYYGLGIYRGTYNPLAVPGPPERVEMEPLKDGTALISWNASPGANQYQIWRAERHPIFIRPISGVEGLVGYLYPSIGDIHDVYVGAYQQIGTTKHTTFVDASVQSGLPPSCSSVPAGQLCGYMYYVLAVPPGPGPGRWLGPGPGSGSKATPFDVVDPGNGKTLGILDDPSNQSNLVAFPALTPSVTFAQLLQQVNVLDQRGVYKDPNKQLSAETAMITKAQRLAMNCKIPQAIGALDPNKPYIDVLEPDATDLSILIGKMIRRLQIYMRFPTQVMSNEFCSG
jgi:hypothetical protein